MNRNTLQSNFEGDLKVLKKSKLSGNHEYNSLLTAVEKFHRDFKLSSLQCKDRSQLNQQWEDQQFYRILVRMMHEVTITTGMKQKEDLKKVYQWYQTNKSVLHSQPHFKGAAAKDIYKRPVLKFAPDALKYYSTPHDRRRHKRVAFDGDGKARRRHQSSRQRDKQEEEELLEEVGAESEDGRRGGMRPVTAPAGLHRPKVSNSLHKSPESSRPGSAQDEVSFAAGFVNDHVSTSSPDLQMMQRPSSALGLIRQAQTSDLESLSGGLKTNVSPEDYLSSTLSNHSAPSSGPAHSPQDDSQSESSKPDPNSPRSPQNSHVGLESQSESSNADMEAILKYKHPISSLVNPIARIHFDEELYDGGQSPDERSKSPIKLQMHIDIPTDSARESRPMTADDKKAENLQKWMAFQQRQDYGQDVAAMQSFYGHGGLPSNMRYASHGGGEMPEFYTQDMISSYAEDDQMNSPQLSHHPSDAITSPSLEQFYELTERHSPQPRPSSRSGKYTDTTTNKQSTSVRGYIADDVASQLRNGLVTGTSREKTVKFESVVDLADQVGDQLAFQKEKLTPEPRHGYRQPMLKISPFHPRPHSAKQVATSPPLSEQQAPPPPTSQSGTSLQESSNVLFAPPNSSRQSTCSDINSSTDFTPRNKRGDPIILLPETSQYTVHFRRKDRPETVAYIPHAISKQGRVTPDQQRYKWRDDGFGNLTYYQIPSRASSAPGKRNLRSAGSTSAGYRPKTATEQSTRYEWSKHKATESKPRIPQAASHNTVSIAPQTLSSLMVVNHLGNEHKRGRARMGGHGYYLDEDVESSPPTMEYMSFTGPAKLTSRGHIDKAISIPTDETHSSDITTLHPLSQASPLESIPSQEWLYKQGSSNGITEGHDMLGSSQGYADSLNAGSERTDDRSLSQDLGDLDDMDDDDALNQSHDSQDLGSDLQSSGVGSLHLDDYSSIPQDNMDNDHIPNPVNIDSTDVPLQETDAADLNNFEEEQNQSDDEVVAHAEGIRPVNEHSADSEDFVTPAFEDTASSLGAVEVDLPNDEPEFEGKSDAGLSSEHSARANSSVEDDDRLTHISNYSESHIEYGTDGHQGTSSEEEMRQAPEEILNRHFLAVTRNHVHRPKSANPRLYDAGGERWNHYHEKGRPSSAREEGVPSVFTIEIDQSSDEHSTRSLQTVPIAYMALSDEHRSQLQQRALPLVDQQRPHYRGHHTMSPVVTKKPLTPRGSARHSSRMSPRGSDRSGSPAPSIDLSPATTRENSVYSPMGSRSGSPMTTVLHAHLDNLEESGRLEAMMPNLMKEMMSHSHSQPSFTDEGPPEPPASINGSWSDVQTEASPGPSHKLFPPQIEIQRPSSAPLTRTDSSPSVTSSRPSSARVGHRPRASTERAPFMGTTSTAPNRQRSVSSAGQGEEWKGRPLPVYGGSRTVEREARAVQLAQEAKSSVNIRELFSGSAAKEHRKELERQERERWEKMQRDNKHLNRFYREHMMRQEIAMVQRPDILDRGWAREYMSDKMLKDKMRQDKWSEHMRQQALENRRALSLLKRIGPSVDIWELFHGGKRGVTKAQMKKAAVTIQKYVRGWVVRTMLEKVKQKSRVHAGSFKAFVKYYAYLMKRIARWHGVKKPNIHLDLWQMDEFMDRKRYYEYVFAKRAQPNDSITIRDLEGFFKECDHYPSKREIFNAISGATKKDGKKLDAKLNEKEVIEVTFMIYVPQGSNLKLQETRKSTWLNPLVDGKEAKKLMGSDEVEKAEYAKSLQLVFAAFQERQEKEAAAKKREQKQKEEAGGAS
ncbi:uncharacterized protein LOC119727530 isoform X2 [Patiria miniata]|uniref:Uncharacterized protein n=1 Tax=Patiria miniata TaxID=46514 RepID=A0A913ZUI2_PATMI|nr:uncharacterized protein LOC119727530 isoform X2 [Patiria miniata]